MLVIQPQASQSVTAAEGRGEEQPFEADAGNDGLLRREDPFLHACQLFELAQEDLLEAITLGGLMENIEDAEEGPFRASERGSAELDGDLAAFAEHEPAVCPQRAFSLQNGPGHGNCRTALVSTSISVTISVMRFSRMS